MDAQDSCLLFPGFFLSHEVFLLQLPVRLSIALRLGIAYRRASWSELGSRLRVHFERWCSDQWKRMKVVSSVKCRMFFLLNNLKKIQKLKALDLFTILTGASN